MKNFTKAFLFVFAMNIAVLAQLQLPRESNRAMVMQVVGDTTLSISYHRPNIKGRKIWGDLVPYNQVWRSGANDATVFETSNDITINGQPLAKGKYSLYSIPTEKDVTVIFNKVWEQWGTVYDQKQDALRVVVTPQAVPMSRETLMYEFETVKDNSTDAVLSWGTWRIPFNINVGDINSRVLTMIRQSVQNRTADDVRPLNQGANYILTSKLKNNYREALDWINLSIKSKESFGNLTAKARLLYEMGMRNEAIAAGEKAVAFAKSQTPIVNFSAFEKTLADWKMQK